MKPASMRIVVDLPAPFGPRKPTTSPRPTVKDTLSTAVKVPKRLVSPSISIRGASVERGPGCYPWGLDRTRLRSPALVVGRGNSVF